MKLYEGSEQCDCCHRRAQLVTEDEWSFYCWVCAPLHEEWMQPESDEIRAEYVRYKREKYGPDWQAEWEEGEEV